MKFRKSGTTTTTERVRQSAGRSSLFYHQQLERLAFFLTGEESMAEACLTDATALLESHQKAEFENWLEQWGRRATIRSAIAQQRARIRRWGRIYERVSCPQSAHTILTLPQLTLLQKAIDAPEIQSDLLCRLALVLRGIERYSPVEAARMLEVSTGAVEAAYCVALEAYGIVDREAAEDADRPVADETRWPRPLCPEASAKAGPQSVRAWLRAMVHRALPKGLGCRQRSNTATKYWKPTRSAKPMGGLNSF